MSFFPSTNVFLQLGNYSISMSALCWILGFNLCYLASRLVNRWNSYSYLLTEDLFLGSAAFFFIGARLGFVYINHPDYFEDLLKIVTENITEIDVRFGVLAMILFIILFCLVNRLNLIRLADAVVPNLFLGMAVLLQRHLFTFTFTTQTVDESYFDGKLSFLKNYMIQDGVAMRPDCFYVGIFCLALFVVISILFRFYKNRKRGQLTALSLIGYGLVRLQLSYLGHELNWLLTLACLLCGILFLWKGNKLMRNKPIILFDLDGTLLDTQPAIFYSFEQLFKHYAPETEVTKEMLNSVLGPSLLSSIQRFFPNEDATTLIEEYRMHNKAAHLTMVKPMEGCAELLAYLKQEGYKMGIVSTKKRDIVELGLKQNDLLEYFDVILGDGDVLKGKPDPEGLYVACEKMHASRDNVIYVGDTNTDIQAARNAKMFSIGYVFNLDRKQDLIDSKPNRVIENLLEIKAILKEDHSWTLDEK